jgi:hypothetical protein
VIARRGGTRVIRACITGKGVKAIAAELRISPERDRLYADSSRVEREIVKYAALSQSIIQLTKIIANGVTHLKKCRMRRASASSRIRDRRFV